MDNNINKYTDNADQSIIKAYYDDIKRYPVLSDDEIKKLIKEYQSTKDINIRNKIVNHNQRMIVKIASNLNSSTTMSFLDKIQEANIIFMHYLERFDLSRDVTFSTYIYKCIDLHLKRDISCNSNVIKIGAHITECYNKYLKYKDYYNSIYQRNPSDREIMDYLDISEGTLKTIVDVERNIKNIVSLDSQIGEDNDTSLIDLTPSNTSEISDYQKKDDERLLLYKLKKILDDYEYYLIYHCILYKGNVNVSKELYLTSHHISVEVRRILNKIKDKKILEYEPSITPNQLSRVSLDPFDFSKKVILIYLKDILSPDEFYYLYYSWYINMDDEMLIEKMNSKCIDYFSMKKYINDMYGKLLSFDESYYCMVVEKLRSRYSVRQIMALDVKLDSIDYLKVINNIDESSYDDIIRIIEDNNIEITSKQRKMLDEYFDSNYSYDRKTLDTAIRNITLKKHGYIGDKYLPLDLLYKVYVDNKELYDPEYRNYLEGMLFSPITHKHVKYNLKLHRNIRSTIRKLEELYYDIDHYFLYDMSLVQLKNTYEKYQYLFNDVEKRLIKGKIYLSDESCYDELMKELNADKKYVNNIYGHAIDKLQNLYLGLYNGMLLDGEEHYLQYINDDRFQMSDDNRKICKLRYEDKLGYKEIMNIMNLKRPQDVSNIVKRVEKKIDMHFYNVMNEIRYDDDNIRIIINNRFSNDPEKAIVTRLFLNKENRQDIYKDYDKRVVGNTASLFKHHYLHTFSDKNISFDDYEREVSSHITDTILNEIDRKIVSLMYGIKSDYNKDGIICSLNDISKSLKISISDLRKRIRDIRISIGARKSGIIGPDLGRLSREDIIEALEDSNIPLLDEDKQLLREVKGIDVDTLSLKELSKKYSINESSVRRRIYLSYVSILRYRDDKRHNKFLDFNNDVFPLLKFFPKFEQDILVYIYRDKKNEYDISKIFGIDKNKARNYMMKAKKRLYYYIKKKKTKKFDFDYAREILYKEDLPFYGDADLARKYFIGYFGVDGNVPKKRSDLIKELNLYDDYKTHNMLKDFMISVLKYKEGYRKIKSFDRDDIYIYYHDNKKKYNGYCQRLFEKELNDDHDYVTNIREPNRFVTMEMLKSKGIKMIDLNNVPMDKRVELIRRNPYKLSKSQIEAIRKYYKISKRVFMNGERKRKLFNYLSRFLVERNNVKKMVNKEVSI